jgi:tetratricopeptide (TPR) repeat protein
MEDGGNAAIQINLGLSYESKGDYGRALESYKKAQSLDPSDKAININLGNAYQGLGRFPEAFDAFTKGLESNKRDLAAYNIFLLSRKRGDNDRAEKMSALLKKEFPSSVHCARVSGEMFLARGDTAKAAAAYEGIKDKDAHDWYALGKIYAQRGQRQQAENALAKVPNDGEWGREKKLLRAQAAFKGGDYKGAFALYREVTGTVTGQAGFGDKETETHIYNMVLAAYQGGMHREALEAAASAVKRVQGQGRAEIIRIAGNSAVALKNWQEAKNWFTQLATIEPNNAVTQYNLAVAHYNLGEVEDAHSRYQKARGLDKNIYNKDIETRYEQFKRGGGAAQSGQSQPSARPRNDSLDTWYNRAVDLQNAKKAEQAEKLYKKILEQDPTYSEAWNNLGAIHGARGELEQAEAAYVKSIEITPAPNTFANLINIYIAMEDYAKAQSAVTKGLSQNPGNRTLAQLEQKIKAKGK